LVNAHHIKAVPGRKTDARDCEWLADLLRHGLVRSSFVPDRPQRDLRELTRYRAQLVGEHTAGVNRLQQTLEGANIKLAAVATDIMGVSGRAILTALVGGETDAAVLADLAVGRLRSKLPALEQALVGRFGSHQRFLVAEQLAHLDDLEASIARVSDEIATRLAAHAGTLERLDAIPGIGRRAAETLLAEIGPDVARFGNPTLRRILVEAAQAAGRTKATYLGAQYRRFAKRLGSKKAAVAVAHSLLIIVYSLLRHGTTYHDLGADYFIHRDRTGVQRRAIRQLESLGFQVDLHPLAAD
jgi:transposase